MRWSLTLLLPSLALAAPVPKAKDPPPPFPMTEGDISEYEYRTKGKSNGGYTEQVTEVEKQKDGSCHVTVRTSITGAESYTATFAVSDKDLSRVVEGDKKLAKPSRVLKLPLAVGTKWEEVNTKCEVTGEEEIEVKAGKFKAMKVESSNGTGKTTTWYASGVGIVKMVSDTTPTVLELKSFTPSK